ncbi:hypothetical protein, variant [Verruconis gallopava]|nr:hypothetical protein, variant [Verruconis gallopava]KIW06051.1 hypothetical protein, variant [Verruconis gallopava]
MVVCTSVYRPGVASQKRAAEAPIVRRLFASSPKDPRYHMLSHLSTKFQRDVEQETHEPRAALFLNRFTRTLTIMYATSGIEQVIGISGEDMKGRSFYYCIAENCLEDAVKCLETAKGNDSIAYLRFWFRDPRQDDVPPSSESENETDAEMTDVTETEDEDGGGSLSEAAPQPAGGSSASSSSAPAGDRTMAGLAESSAGPSQPSGAGSSQERTPTSPPVDRNEPIELEAVVSCTSDGLVVILRRARPLMPGVLPEQMQTGRAVATAPQPAQYPRGIFAAPWAPEPVFIPEQPRPALAGWYHGMHPQQVQPMPAPSGPSPQDFMNSIREVAVFAWALVGINGNLAQYGRGRPGEESQPADGLPIWDPRAIDSGNVTQTGTPATTSPQPTGTSATRADTTRA